MLALAQPAEAEVVVTKKTFRVDQGRPVFLDLNKDGLPDFEFSATYMFGSSTCGCHNRQAILIKTVAGGGVVGGSYAGQPGPYASALARGAKIGPSAHFANGKVVIEAHSNSYSTNFYDGKWYYVGPNRFLGVKFQIKGETHYGWIRMTVDAPGAVGNSIVTGYAYETVANKRITAGQAAASMADAESSAKKAGPSLGKLALGADGQSLWRIVVKPETQRLVRTSN
jgi:hypothetical protein